MVSHSQTAIFSFILRPEKIGLVYQPHRKSCAGTHCYLGWVIIENGFSAIGNYDRFLGGKKNYVLNAVITQQPSLRSGHCHLLQRSHFQ